MSGGNEPARPLEEPIVDPITFEVIKHRLWQINDEQGIAIKTISSSPVVVEGNDFNVGLFTADGQLSTIGAGVLSHVGTMGKTLKSILELAGEIADGDVFMTNDPFLGALHQSDLVVASPLFHDGRILLWAGNVLHHPDVGGIDEGSFCISARNLYQEPPRYFLKIVSRGRLQPEVEHTFVTNSRLPDMVALDLRAQIGAIHVAKQRLKDLIAERGSAVVHSVMHRSIDMAERQLREKIASLPEGSWSGEAFMDGVRIGDDRIVRVKVTLTHAGERLKFDFTGSDPQVDAAVNCTYHACVAATAVPLYAFLCQGDIDWNEGLIRCLDVVAPEGTVVNATFPAPVSICTIGFRWLTTVAAAQAVAKMFDASPNYRDRICPSWTVSGNCNNLFGLDRNGRRVGALLSDHRGGGASARSFADGISHAGQITSATSNMGNVESAEWKLPLLYLFRRQLADSGGAGRFRGGLTSIAAVMPYGVPELILKSTNTAGTDQTNAHGISGGYPGAGSQTIVVHDSDALDLMRRHRLETDFRALGGTVEYLPSKAGRTLGARDILAFYAPGGGGYGDPLERDCRAVARDVANGWVSREAAQALYGVRLAEDGTADVEAAATLRRHLYRERCDGEAGPFTPEAGRPKQAQRGPQRVGDQIAWICEGADAVLSCMKCGNALSGPTGRVVTRRASMGKAGPWAAIRWGGESPNFVLQERACASCGMLFDVREVRT
jgi:N-methylhydantoinase B